MTKPKNKKYSFTAIIIGLNLGVALGAGFENIPLGIALGIFLAWLLNAVFTR